MASFLLGAPSLIEQDYLLADVAIRGTEYSVYVADDWRATSKLTLNLGLRYELDTPFTESLEPVGQLRSGHGHRAGRRAQRRQRDGRRQDLLQGVRAAPRLRLPARRRAPWCAAAPGIFWNTPGNGGNVLRLHRHVPFGPIYSFNPGNQFVTRRVSDGFPDIPPLDLALADNPDRQRDRRRSRTTSPATRSSST